jgi:hypothetical protein
MDSPSPWPSDLSARPPATFLSLPLELRQKIYQYIFTDSLVELSSAHKLARYQPAYMGEYAVAEGFFSSEAIFDLSKCFDDQDVLTHRWRPGKRYPKPRPCCQLIPGPRSGPRLEGFRLTHYRRSDICFACRQTYQECHIVFIQQTVVDVYDLPIRTLAFVMPPLWRQNIKSITTMFKDSHQFPFATFPQLEHLHVEHSWKDRGWRSIPTATQSRLGNVKLDSELSLHTAGRLRAEMIRGHVDLHFADGSTAVQTTAEDIRKAMAGIKTLITWYIYRDNYGTVRLDPASGEIITMTTTPSFSRDRTRKKVGTRSNYMPHETVGWLGLPPPLSETRLRRIDFDHPSYPNFCHGLAFTAPQESEAAVPSMVQGAVSEPEDGRLVKKRKLHYVSGFE